MRLTDAVAASLAEQGAPAAVLALTYAERIDEATHVPLGLAAALDTLREAAQLADESTTADQLDDTHMTAFRKVAAALSAVTVASDLGPKLLATLDALLLTPKARAKVGQKLDDATTAASPLGALRAEEDELASRRARHTG